MRAVLVTVFVLLASPVLADDCRYVSPSGDVARIADDNLVIHIGSDDMFCAIYAEEQMAECPTSDGEDTREFPITIGADKLTFLDADWLKRCDSPA